MFIFERKLPANRKSLLSVNVNIPVYRIRVRTHICIICNVLHVRYDTDRRSAEQTWTRRNLFIRLLSRKKNVNFDMDKDLCQRRFNFRRSACVLYELFVSQRDQLRLLLSRKIGCFSLYFFQWKLLIIYRKVHQHNKKNIFLYTYLSRYWLHPTTHSNW